MTFPADWNKYDQGGSVNYAKYAHSSFASNNLTNHSTNCLNLYGDRSVQKFSIRGTHFRVKNYSQYNNAISTRLIVRNNTENAIPTAYVLQRYIDSTHFYAFGQRDTTTVGLNTGLDATGWDYMHTSNLRIASTYAGSWMDWYGIRMDTWPEGPDLRIKGYIVNGYTNVDLMPSDVTKWQLVLDAVHVYGQREMKVNYGGVIYSANGTGREPYGVEYPGGECGFGTGHDTVSTGDAYETYVDSFELKTS